MFGEVVTAGLLMSYVNFVTHESYIFAPLREKIVKFLKVSVVKSKWYGDFLYHLWKCHLCHNFYLGIAICLIFDFPFIISLTSPVIAAILSIWIKKNQI
jgi:hypothetical protein